MIFGQFYSFKLIGHCSSGGLHLSQDGFCCDLSNIFHADCWKGMQWEVKPRFHLPLHPSTYSRNHPG